MAAPQLRPRAAPYFGSGAGAPRSIHASSFIDLIFATWSPAGLGILASGLGGPGESDHAVDVWAETTRIPMRARARACISVPTRPELGPLTTSTVRTSGAGGLPNAE